MGKERTLKTNLPGQGRPWSPWWSFLSRMTPLQANGPLSPALLLPPLPGLSVLGQSIYLLIQGREGHVQDACVSLKRGSQAPGDTGDDHL